ncbi:MAG: AEC family transporter [Halanaerobiales bacterium]
MDIFIFIILNNITPIFIIILLGILMERKFQLDINSFSKANFYIFVPALAFVKIYETEIKLELLQAILFGVLFVFLLSFTGVIISKIRGHDIARTNALKNSIMFYNSGNFGLPLITLVFEGMPEAVSIQIMILMVQSLTTNTLGFYNAGRGQMKFKETIISVLKMPTVYALIAALFLKLFPVNLKNVFFWPAIDYMKDGLIPVALLTLGIQLSLAKIEIKNLDVYIASVMRLIGSPLLAYILVYIMGIDGLMAQVLFISSAVPSAVNTALIAVEFKNEPDFASQIVMTTTLMSALTLTGVIYLSFVLF